MLPLREPPNSLQWAAALRWGWEEAGAREAAAGGREGPAQGRDGRDHDGTDGAPRAPEGPAGAAPIPSPARAT